MRFKHGGEAEKVLNTINGLSIGGCRIHVNIVKYNNKNDSLRNDRSKAKKGREGGNQQKGTNQVHRGEALRDRKSSKDVVISKP